MGSRHENMQFWLGSRRKQLWSNRCHSHTLVPPLLHELAAMEGFTQADYGPYQTWNGRNLKIFKRRVAVLAVISPCPTSFLLPFSSY
jgi:hypothetical protein